MLSPDRAAAAPRSYKLVAGHGHVHSLARPLRRFAGRRGVWVHHHDWCRPLVVWRYRGAWRVVCWACWPTAIRSDDPTYGGGGWPTQQAAFAAALAHCAECTEVTADV
jgi:hypothetical protein